MNKDMFPSQEQQSRMQALFARGMQEGEAEHFMIDIETSCLATYRDVITSLAIVPFELPDLIHNAYKQPVIEVAIENHDRFEDPATILWREEHGVSNMEADIELHLKVADVFDAISNALPDDNTTYYLWAKPTLFDLAALTTMYGINGKNVPWHHRHVVDLTSFCAGLGVNLIKLQKDMLALGEIKRSHDASSDCYDQIKTLRSALLLAVANQVGGVL